jgi:hypothetical protein
MCTRYVSPYAAAIERQWHIGGRNPWRGGELFPNRDAPFLLAARKVAEPERELVVGQWSLIPWFASCGLSGLWNVWTDKASGEMVESYTLLTINADQHLVMRRMHRPDPKRATNMQDKRSVVSIQVEDVDQWLFGTVEEAKGLVRLPVFELLHAAPS